MNQIHSNNLQPLDKQLRKKLESAVKDARDAVESAAQAACLQLGVGAAKADGHLNEDEKKLRRRLRIHGRQLGDVREENGKQEVDRLVEEIGYQHWHRMLFARFLAENNLLMYPDPDQPVAITLEECEDLAADEGAKNGWELAAKYAATMLPQIFRVDSPVFALTLPTEIQQQLEKILSDLPVDVFTASDSLGWVYQFWQAKRKDEVDASEVKIGARELPAVTQLFTEPYMVSFLLDNSLGAWWAARRLDEEDFRTAGSEQELREKAALPGVPLEYLRFVRTQVGNEVEGEENTGPWTPAAGTFDAWPESLSELKTLDPCCGSGHFLVAALLMLTPMRMELEGESASEAVDRVLSENLHGLEIDQRCVELAAFALALAAWRFPSEGKPGGFRVLPDLNVACCGLSITVDSDEWAKALAGDSRLESAMEELHEQFRCAPSLGSLVGAESVVAKDGLFKTDWDEVVELLKAVTSNLDSDEELEIGVVAAGTARVAALLGIRYQLVATNPPYLSRGKQGEVISDFAEKNFNRAKNDLANVFLERCVQFLAPAGVVQFVMPQNWLFLPSYKEHRAHLLKHHSWNSLARLGMAAFEIMDWWAFNVILISISRLAPSDDTRLTAIDVGDTKIPGEKSQFLRQRNVKALSQDQQLKNPDSIIVLEELGKGAKLGESTSSLAGLDTGDNLQFKRKFFETPSLLHGWVFQLNSVASSIPFSGREHAVLWEDGKGRLVRCPGARMSNVSRWGTKGVYVTRMNRLPATLCNGESWDRNGAMLAPDEEDDLLPLWCYCSSNDFLRVVRLLNQKVSVAESTFEKIPFDREHWQEVASEKYPHGLPEPYSDDPTQWIFHGHPGSSTDALQVAVARLLGYRWPAELDEEMELATDARAWVKRSSQLNDLADEDGIVCIPAVGTEQPAEGRLLNLLHRAYEAGRAQEQIFREKLAAADENDPVTVDLWRRGWQPILPDTFQAWRDSLLKGVGHQGKTFESWLRDKFFTQHMKLFHHRPFIWHIWDGLPDGFSALINYHKLDNKLLKTLIYTYLNDWIKKQETSSEDGHEERLAAANSLKQKLEKILEGESPHDIFVRWKPLEEQPIGWNPDLNDGVRLNIRPWMTVGDVKKKGAGILRDKPNCKWGKDRGKDVESAPWYHLGPEYGEKVAARINDHHLTLAEKKSARD